MSACPCHPTYGAHLRAKNIRIAYCNSAGGRDATDQKRWDKEIALMDDCKRQGVVPRTSKMSDMRAALDASDSTGSAFGGMD